MARYADSITDQYGAPVNGASIYVYDQSEALAALTEDGGGALANPVTSDQYGDFHFNTDDGLYSLTFHYGGRQIFRDEAVMVGEGLPIPDSVLTPLAAPSGSSVIGFHLAGTGAVAETVQTALRRIVYAEQYGFATAGTGVANATALAYAIAALPLGGVINIGPGTFTLDQTTVPSGITIAGAGMDVTILVQGAVTGSYGTLYANSGGAAAFVSNVTLRDFTLKATAGTFSEFKHLLSLNGMKNLLIERVKLQGFRGDGLFLGSGVAAADERHNVNVTIRQNVFDGVNNANRNAITVADGDEVWIEDNAFINCTLLDDSMPGPIDCEASGANAFSVFRNIYVLNNSFEACGGSAVGLLLPGIVLTNAPENFIIKGNRIKACGHALSVIWHTGSEATTSALRLGVQFRENIVRDCVENDYLIIDGVLGCEVEDNTFDGCDYIALGLFTAANRDIAVRRNHFLRCGDVSSFAIIQDTTLTDGYFEENRFTDTLGVIYYLRGAAANMTGVHIDRNIAERPNVITTSFAIVVGGYAGTIDATSSFKGNVYPSSIAAGALATSMLGVYRDQLTGSVTVDVASIAAQTVGVVTVTVTGAALGDFALASVSSDLETGLGISAFVSAADTVKIRLVNPTSGAIDPASRTYYARVWKR